MLTIVFANGTVAEISPADLAEISRLAQAAQEQYGTRVREIRWMEVAA